MPTTQPIVIMGAGAAGLMAAIQAGQAGAPVLVVESTVDGGRKILISGGGRCNVLPAALDPGRFVSDSSSHLLRRLLLSWPLAGQRGFFEQELAIPLQLEEESGKLFPVSNRARDVRDALLRAARKSGVRFAFGRRVVGVQREGGSWRVGFAEGEPIMADAVVVATGGLSVPSTGSAGFGLELARSLGHAVNSTYAALTPLTADPPSHGMLAGVSLTVTLSAGSGRRRLRARGGFLFTHKGYSGPAVLDLSHVAVRSGLEGGERPSLRVQWTEEDAPAWDSRLQDRSPKAVLTLLRESLPSRLAERLLMEAGINAERQLAQLSRPERKVLVNHLVNYPLPWTGDEGYKKAEVTGGGVALGEVDPATLESRRHPGLFFCGEVLDAFGPIGGHNFAWAWATGRAAGLGAAATIRRKKSLP